MTGYPRARDLSSTFSDRRNVLSVSYLLRLTWGEAVGAFFEGDGVAPDRLCARSDVAVYRKSVILLAPVVFLSRI